MLSVKQRGIKYHILSLWNDSTYDWTPVSRTTGEHSNHYANGPYLSVCISKSKKIICFSFSRTDVELCIYHLSVCSNLNFLHDSKWITFSMQPCILVLIIISHLVSFFYTDFGWFSFTGVCMTESLHRSPGHDSSGYYNRSENCGLDCSSDFQFFQSFFQYFF